MKEVKLKWIKDNAPKGCSNYVETNVYMEFIFPNEPNKNVKVKKPEWMVWK